MSEQIEQPRGEDGRFVSPTPQPDASAAAAPVASDAAITDAGGEHAPVTSAPVMTDFDGKSDPYEAAVKTISAKYADDPSTVVAADQTAKPASPAPTPTGQNTRDAKTTPSPSPTQAVSTPSTPDPAKEYGDTLSKKEFDLLKSVPGFLPPPAEWREMSVTERIEHLQDVRNIRAERARQFNQTNDPRQGNQTVSEPGPQTQPRGARDAGVSSAPPPVQPGAVQLPPDIEANLAQVAQEFGEESSVYRSQRAMAERFERQIQSQQMQQQASAQAQANERQMRAIEDGVFTNIQAKYPPLADAATRDKLRQDARDLFVIRHQQGRPLTPQQAIEFVTHNTLYPEIQRAQQKQADANRQRSLAGTFDRGAPAPSTPAAAKPKSEDEVYEDAMKTINAREKQKQLAGAA